MDEWSKVNLPKLGYQLLEAAKKDGAKEPFISEVNESGIYILDKLSNRHYTIELRQLKWGGAMGESIPTSHYEARYVSVESSTDKEIIFKPEEGPMP